MEDSSAGRKVLAVLMNILDCKAHIGTKAGLYSPRVAWSTATELRWDDGLGVYDTSEWSPR
jgi:hypothetical protein